MPWPRKVITLAVMACALLGATASAALAANVVVAPPPDNANCHSRVLAGAVEMNTPFIALCPEITRSNALTLTDWLEDEAVTRYLSDSRNVSRMIEQVLGRVQLPILTHLFNQGGRFFMACDQHDVPGDQRRQGRQQAFLDHAGHQIGEQDDQRSAGREAQDLSGEGGEVRFQQHRLQPAHRRDQPWQRRRGRPRAFDDRAGLGVVPEQVDPVAGAGGERGQQQRCVQGVIEPGHVTDPACAGAAGVEHEDESPVAFRHSCLPSVPFPRMPSESGLSYTDVVRS